MSTARCSCRGNHATRGVSLIEALVAFAVLAFGMLGVVGMQATLRHNADIAKQRSEAVRIAEEKLENWRAFSVLNPTAGHANSYAAIASAPQAAVLTTNTTYQLTGTVVESVPPANKTLIVDVEWTDRRGLTQNVRLSSLAAGVAPELAATLVSPSSGTPTRSPFGRHRAIPPQARDFGNGKSGFLPPQPEGVTEGWLFDNVTGWFKVCATVVGDNAVLTQADLVCAADDYLLVQGYVRYATKAVQPVAADVDDANALGPDTPKPGIAVVQTAPAAVAGVRSCFVSTVNNALREFYCGARILLQERKWSGSLRFGPPLPLAVDANDHDAAAFRVCRYAFVAAAYVDVTQALRNQNFVVIRAGDGVNAFTCPAGVTSTHQP